jgi:hypothetical protein
MVVHRSIGGFLKAAGGITPGLWWWPSPAKKGGYMTDSNKTLIAALLDRSGSMEESKEFTEGGWRELVNTQRSEPEYCEVTLAQFDTEYEVLYPPTPIASVPEFVVVPRGMTALLDSAGKFITEVGQQLAALPEDQRPGRVICLIMTDGMENSSRQWDWEAVKKLITQQREVYGWKFIFLGADIDAVEVGARMGVDPRYAMTFDKRSHSTVRAAYARTSEVMTGFKRDYLDDEGFTESDRARAMGEAPKKKSKKRGA